MPALPQQYPAEQVFIFFQKIVVLKTAVYVLSLSEGQTKHLGKDGVKQ